MKLYNTLTRRKQEFKTADGTNTVRMYSCGPTVYNYAHIGNLRTYVFMDLLRRVLKYEGYNLKGVMNITDVGHLLSDGDDGEDKMAKTAREQQKDPYEIAEYYTGVFMKDFERLNIDKPEIICKATDHIPQMIDYVVGLCEKGYGYETDDGIYYDISKFSDYGMLSGNTINDLKAGARIEVNNGKRNPYDFAIWKKAPKEHIMQWPSPWGQGYPGWHIECSAMSREYLGDVFDIHTGGVDHIPIHHENEIAQSQGLTGVQPANFWIHGDFMLVDGGKMSKSLGNTYTIDQLIQKGYDPMVFRYFCLNAHYRKKLNFTFETMDGAKVSYERLCQSLLKHKNSSAKTSEEVLAKYKQQFVDCVTDDLNIPSALGVLWTLLKEPASIDVYNLVLDFDRVFGLSLDKVEEKVAVIKNSDIPSEIIQKAEEMQSARKEKNWAVADGIRAELLAQGYIVKNTKDGYEIEKK
ncbi:MAG: cysteine--tRNA ligase [Clostridia bacterium]|nr:cysteine--tRNA ligase [Clostridia bacterium]